MVINCIMCTSEILANLCFPKQEIKTKKTFVRVICSVLVVHMYWKNIKWNVWPLMVQNLQDFKKEQLC